MEITMQVSQMYESFLTNYFYWNNHFYTKIKKKHLAS